MASRGLLGRLASPGSSARRPDQEVGSIIEHLKVLLNTRQGESVTVPDFGIVDFTDLVHNFPEAIQTLQRAIRTTVLTFEPRLKNVVVQHVRDDELLVVKFQITAQLAAKGARGSVRFETQVCAGGQVLVR